MNLKEYQQAAQRTLPDLGRHIIFNGDRTWQADQNILHMLIGMFSEYNELLSATDDVNRAEELTDINWYLTNYCNLVGITPTDPFFSHLFSVSNVEIKYVDELFSAISQLFNIEKRAFAYGKSVDVAERNRLVAITYMRLNDCYQHFNVNPNESMERNINKLKIRFPEKFTQANALTRDLESERKVLEGK